MDGSVHVARLEGQVLCLRQRLTAILALAAEIRQGTIDRVMEKGDLELGLEAFLGIRPPPQSGPTHEISPINAQGVVSERRVRRQSRRMHFKLMN